MSAAARNIPQTMQVGAGGLTLADAQDVNDCIENFKGASTQDAVTASSTQTQAGGTLITTAIVRVTTAGASDAMTIGFNAVPGRSFVILNDSGQTIQLFPKLGDKINDAAANAAVTIADNTYSDYTCPVKGLWFGGATSFET